MYTGSQGVFLVGLPMDYPDDVYIPHPTFQNVYSHIPHPTPSAAHNVIIPHPNSHNASSNIPHPTSCIYLHPTLHIHVQCFYIPHPTSQNVFPPHPISSNTVALYNDMPEKQVMPKIPKKKNIARGVCTIFYHKTTKKT